MTRRHMQQEDPEPHEVADAYDQLDWDGTVHGRMRDYATDPGGEPITVPVEED